MVTGVRAALLFCAACSPNLEHVVVHSAERELRCRGQALRVDQLGELHARTRTGERVLVLFAASGCDSEQLYVCARDTSRCQHDFAALPWPDTRAVFEREHELLRQATRARCPGSELRVAQESASLFQFTACDGSWLYHCRARGCQRLPAAR